jgi:hypothetical protein
MAAEPPRPPEEPSPTLLQTVASVAASFFGVQNSKNRERDFKRGKPVHFVIIALLMTAGFALTVWMVVKLVMRNAGL